MCLGVCFLGSNFFGILWASWTCMSSSFTRLGKFSFIMFSNKFSTSCSSSSSSGTPMIPMLEHLKLSQRFLSLSSFFFSFLCLHSVPVGVYFFLLFQIIDLSSSSLPFAVGPVSVFLYFTLHSLHFFLHFKLYSTISVSILITTVLNSTFDSLAISSSLSSFSEVLMCSFV